MLRRLSDETGCVALRGNQYALRRIPAVDWLSTRTGIGCAAFPV